MSRAKQKIRDAIAQVLVKNTIERRRANIYGLCVVVYMVADPDTIDLVLQPIFERWPKYSGDIKYPVPSPTGQVSSSALYSHTNNMLAGKYGELRLELAQFIIDELDKELKA